MSDESRSEPRDGDAPRGAGARDADPGAAPVEQASEPPEELERREADDGLGAESSVAGTAAASAGGTTVRAASLWGDAWTELRHNPLFLVAGALILLFVVMAAFPALFATLEPCDLSRSLERPSREHWFGFDLLGCDYYDRVIYGARASIVVGTLGTGVAAVIAIVLGSLAGYYEGVLDAFIARIADIWFAIPTILGGIVILNVLQQRGLLTVSLVLIVLAWPTMMRLMRSSVLGAKEHDYIAAARALGAGDLRILTRHILPNAIAPVIVYATITVGILIAAEAALSFLGVGLQLPAISWGLMLSQAQEGARFQRAPHLLFFPGVFLSVTVFSFILLGDALRDALDPKLR